jgi:hypothetical protein
MTLLFLGRSLLPLIVDFQNETFFRFKNAYPSLLDKLIAAYLDMVLTHQRHGTTSAPLRPPEDIALEKERGPLVEGDLEDI